VLLLLLLALLDADLTPAFADALGHDHRKAIAVKLRILLAYQVA